MRLKFAGKVPNLTQGSEFNICIRVEFEKFDEIKKKTINIKNIFGQEKFFATIKSQRDH